MKISEKGLKFLMTDEGFRNKAYKDIYGYWTTGVGHLIKPNEQHLITKTLTNAEVMELLKSDLVSFEKEVNDTIYVPLKQHEYDALVSLAFNIGYGRRAGGTEPDEKGFSGTTLVKRINSLASQDKIINGFSLWNSKGDLKNRRAKEAKLYISGDYSERKFFLTASEMTQFYKV